jgi:hypothetical protein
VKPVDWECGPDRYINGMNYSILPWGTLYAPEHRGLIQVNRMMNVVAKMNTWVNRTAHIRMHWVLAGKLGQDNPIQHH